MAALVCQAAANNAKEDREFIDLMIECEISLTLRVRCCFTMSQLRSLQHVQDLFCIQRCCNYVICFMATKYML